MAFETHSQEFRTGDGGRTDHQKITGGELAPGSQLPSQRDLAQMLGVGRSSIREAINALVVMGFLSRSRAREPSSRRSCRLPIRESKNSSPPFRPDPSLT